MKSSEYRCPTCGSSDRDVRDYVDGNFDPGPAEYVPCGDPSHDALIDHIDRCDAEDAAEANAQDAERDVEAALERGDSWFVVGEFDYCERDAFGVPQTDAMEAKFAREFDGGTMRAYVATIRAHVTAQDAEIARLRDDVQRWTNEAAKYCEDADRWKRMAEAWEGLAYIVARESGYTSFLADLIESPLSPVGRITAAKEATDE